MKELIRKATPVLNDVHKGQVEKKPARLRNEGEEMIKKISGSLANLRACAGIFSMTGEQAGKELNWKKERGKRWCDNSGTKKAGGGSIKTQKGFLALNRSGVGNDGS